MDDSMLGLTGLIISQNFYLAISNPNLNNLDVPGRGGSKAQDIYSKSFGGKSKRSHHVSSAQTDGLQLDLSSPEHNQRT